jgi:WD40 repeat protein
VLQAHDGQVTSLAYSHNGALVATCGTDALVKVWDARAGSLRATLRGSKQSTMSVSFARDGNLCLATVSRKGLRRDEWFTTVTTTTVRVALSTPTPFSHTHTHTTTLCAISIV